MRKRSSSSRSRHRDRAASSHIQSTSSPLGCVTGLLIPAFCCLLFLGVTAIYGSATGSASPALAQKQQILQREIDNGRASAPPQSGSDTPVPITQTPRRAGILHDHQTPFSPSIFTANNAWQGPLGATWMIAYTGAQTHLDGTPGRGGVVLYTDGDFALSYLGTFLAPLGTPALTAISAQGHLLLVQTAFGHLLTFDLLTHQFL